LDPAEYEINNLLRAMREARQGFAAPRMFGKKIFCFVEANKGCDGESRRKSVNKTIATASPRLPV
jgi:hypothetical protein